MKPLDSTSPIGADPAGPGAATPEAIALAYKAYRAELRRFLGRRARSAQDGDDLVQEVYLQLLRFPPREPIRETLAYLYRVAWHVVNRANEKGQREGVAYDLPTLERLAQESGYVVDDLQHQLAQQQQLIHLLTELPPICRQVIVRFKCDGLSYKQISAELNISIHMVEKHIARAVRHIRAAEWD